jgi:hypothetical protein
VSTVHVLPGLDLLAALPASGSWVESVALVGNAPTVLGREDGPRIDDHDAVIRFNDGVSDGFEPHVGSRTDLRVFGARIRERHYDFLRREPGSVPLLTYRFNLETLEALGYAGTVWTFGPDPRPGALERLGELAPPARKYHYPPRTGLVALSMLTGLMLLGRRVSLFGFETVGRPGEAAHYYADGMNLHHPGERAEHCPPEWEFNVLQRLAKAEYVRID